jgi:hypothetical protein
MNRSCCKKSPNRATTKPNPIKARPVRIHARNVRSAARKSRRSALLFLSVGASKLVSPARNTYFHTLATHSFNSVSRFLNVPLAVSTSQWEGFEGVLVNSAPRQSRTHRERRSYWGPRYRERYTQDLIAFSRQLRNDGHNSERISTLALEITLAAHLSRRLWAALFETFLFARDLIVERN